MEKKLKEILSGTMDIDWTANPHRTPGLAEALDKTTKEKRLTIAQLRERASKYGGK